MRRSVPAHGSCAALATCRARSIVRPSALRALPPAFSTRLVRPLGSSRDRRYEHDPRPRRPRCLAQTRRRLRQHDGGCGFARRQREPDESDAPRRDAPGGHGDRGTARRTLQHASRTAVARAGAGEPGTERCDRSDRSARGRVVRDLRGRAPARVRGGRVLEWWWSRLCPAERAAV